MESMLVGLGVLSSISVMHFFLLIDAVCTEKSRIIILMVAECNPCTIRGSDCTVPWAESEFEFGDLVIMAGSPAPVTNYWLRSRNGASWLPIWGHGAVCCILKPKNDDMITLESTYIQPIYVNVVVRPINIKTAITKFIQGTKAPRLDLELTIIYLE